LEPASLEALSVPPRKLPDEKQHSEIIKQGFVQHRRRLKLYLQRRAPPQLANDLVQEVYERLLRYASREPLRDPIAYLYAVASNVAKAANRRGNLRLRRQSATRMAWRSTRLMSVRTYRARYHRQQNRPWTVGYLGHIQALVQRWEGAAILVATFILGALLHVYAQPQALPTSDTALMSVHILIVNASGGAQPRGELSASAASE
jgi:hypothetical protein